MKQIVSMMLLFLVLMSNGQATAKQVKTKYPPYPSVWGYTIDDERADLKHLEFLSDSNGDIVFHYLVIGDKDSYKGYASIYTWFFEGKIEANEDMTVGAWYKFEKAHGFKSITPGRFDNSITYSVDNTRISARCDRDDKGLDDLRTCKIIKDKLLPDAGWLTEVDYNIAMYSVIGISMGKDKQIEINAMPCYMLPLKDRTFLLSGCEGNYVVRFNKDMKTKFKPTKQIRLDDNRVLEGNFFVLPYSKVQYFYENVLKDYTGSYTPDVGRQFLDFLYQEQQNNNKQ